MAQAQRGEVWLVDLGLVAKVRPCLVVSVLAGDTDRALATVLAHTTSPRGSRFEVALRLFYLCSGVLDAQNLVTIPHAKLVRRLGRLSEEELRQVEEALRRWLGLVEKQAQ